MTINGATTHKTAQKQPIGRPFVPGQSGNPAGRPKGARSKLGETFLKALAEDFDELPIDLDTKLLGSHPAEMKVGVRRPSQRRVSF